jgi:hypothetical protein
MAARYYTGIDGALLIGGTRIAKITNWSISASLEALETTATGDAARKFINGRTSYRGNCTAIYYTNDSGNLAMQPLLASTFRTTAISPSQTYTMKFQLSPTRYFEAAVLINETSIQAQAGQIVTASISFTVTGFPSNTSLGET